MSVDWMDPAQQEPTVEDWLRFHLTNPVALTSTHADEVLTAYRADIVPTWEAIYEPGNVSSYLIGYLNDEACAKAACHAWLGVQDYEVTGRLEWEPDPALATGGFDAWFNLLQHHDGGVTTAVGLIVRHITAGGGS